MSIFYITLDPQSVHVFKLQVGKIIMAAASNDIKRVTLELGGKSACVIFDDVDRKFTGFSAFIKIDRAVRQVSH